MPVALGSRARSSHHSLYFGEGGNSEDLHDFLEVWLKVDEAIFSDEVKEMEKLCLRLGRELTQELGVPVKIRLKEEGSFQSLEPSPRVEDLR